MDDFPSDLFISLAWYNTQANHAMKAILAEAPDIAARPEMTYFGSVLDLLSHLVAADTIWIQRMWTGNLPLPAPLEPTYSGTRVSLFTTPDEWWRLREALDVEIETFCARLTPADLSAPFDYTNTAGVAFRQLRWQTLLHMFNHQTHHRGQVAQVLDTAGIENDYSNFIWYLRDR